ncbi:MAG: rare lipoprotein A [Planctomycetota bacterium]|jgi:rare lipoprotein A
MLVGQVIVKNSNIKLNLTSLDHVLRFLLLISSLLLFSCSDNAVKDRAPRSESVSNDAVPDAIPRVEEKSKYGNPKSYEVFGKRYYVLNDNKDFVQRGIASWYGKKFHGRRTSSGETYDMYAMTAAHKSLILPAYVEVTNLDNNKRIIVRVNDRGPFHENRIIDLSYTAASKLGIVANGTGLVEVRAINAEGYANKSKTENYGGLVKTASSEERNGGFYIQVGAFNKESNARKLQKKIAPLGDKLIKISEATVKDKIVYRVQIGPLHNVDAADNIVDKLDDYGITDHRIVVN